MNLMIILDPGDSFFFILKQLGTFFISTDLQNFLAPRIPLHSIY